MTGFQVQGWCPGALRPMMSGDGLVVRLRPFGGRLSPDQAAGIAAAARRHGNGLIDLSARGNLQLRGVTTDGHAALIDALRALDLIDATPLAEAQRAILVTPFADATTDALAAMLAHALQDAPVLPSKFGFVVDTGAAPVLQDTPGDIRLERAADGRLILRADGAAGGTPVTTETAAAAALAMAHWFIAEGGVTDGRGRMAALVARSTARVLGDLAPAPAQPQPNPGLCPQWALVGFEFGQMTADTLAALAPLGPMRLTPWRMVLLQGQSALPRLPDLILDADDPRLRVVACTGAPGCLQGLHPVRALARQLAPHVPPGKRLHLSGCAKGCAHPGACDVTLVATTTGFDVIQNGRSTDAPRLAAPAQGPTDLKGLF
jgi:precorrin-3B synthase